MNNKLEVAKQRLISVLRRNIRNHEEIAADIAWWNENRTDAAPFDLGGDLVAVSLAKKMLVLVEANQPIPDEIWNRYQAQCQANANH